MSLDNDTDEDFIGYCRIHSETERALFSKKHVVRILRLAGYDKLANALEDSNRDFLAVYSDEMHPICDAALRRLKQPQPSATIIPFPVVAPGKETGM